MPSKRRTFRSSLRTPPFPVINGLDILEHPCQILADLQTIKEKKGRLEGLHFTFIGDGDDNLTHSYMLGCAMAGMDVTVISPKKYWPQEYYIRTAKEVAAKKKPDGDHHRGP